MISFKFLSVACILSVLCLTGCEKDSDRGPWNDALTASSNLHGLVAQAEAVRTLIPEDQQAHLPFVLFAQSQGIDDFFFNLQLTSNTTDLDTLLILVLIQAAGAQHEMLQEMIATLTPDTTRKMQLRDLAIQMKVEALRLQNALKSSYAAQALINNATETVHSDYSEMRYYNAENSQDGRPTFEAAEGPAVVNVDCPNQEAALVVELEDVVANQRITTASGVDPVQVEYTFATRTPVAIKISPQANTRLGGDLNCRVSMKYARYAQTAPKAFDPADQQMIYSASGNLDLSFQEWTTELNRLAGIDDPALPFNFLGALYGHKLRHMNRIMEIFKFAEASQFFPQDKTEIRWVKDLSLAQLYRVETIMGRRTRALNSLGRILKLVEAYQSEIILNLK